MLATIKGKEEHMETKACGYKLGFIVLLIVCCGVGCGQDRPKISHTEVSGDNLTSINTVVGTEAAQVDDETPKLVTGLNATTLDDQPSDPNDQALTSEDKEGAVGVTKEF